MSILKPNMPVALCCDHAGFDTKQAVIEYFKQEGIEYKDFGTYNTDSCDYPDFAHPMAEALETGEFSLAVGICGSGEGMAMTLNKHAKVRASLCWLPEIARLTRQHNDSNVLVLPARFFRICGTGFWKKMNIPMIMTMAPPQI